MLPFLQKPKPGGISIELRKPDKEPDSSDQDAPMESCARDLIDSIESKDVKGVVRALYAAFDIMEASEPKEEPEMTEDSE